MDGADIYEPGPNDLEALARRFHPDFTWGMLRDDERKGLLAEWRRDQSMRGSPRQETHASTAVSRAASETDLVRLVGTVQKLVELQSLAAKTATKASAHLVIRTVGRVLHPIIEREQQQRSEMQR